MSNLTANLAHFTEDILTAVSEVVYSNGWQNTGGVMQFSDALGVFRNVLEELRAADDEDLIEGMPIALQQTLQTHLANVQGNFGQIQGGNNQVQSFTDEVDRLHLDVWQGGFRYRGRRVLGYEAKYRQIAELAKEIEAIREREATARDLMTQVLGSRDQAKAAQDELTAAKAIADQQVTEVAQIHTLAQQVDASLQTQVVAVDDRVLEATESALQAEAKAQSAITNEQRLQDFVGRVDTSEKRLTDALQQANASLAEHGKALAAFMSTSRTEVDDFKETKTTELDAFQERLKTIEKDIVDKLSKATGITLFHAFEKRQEQITGHWIWLAIAGTVLASVISMTAYFVSHALTADAAFYIKLSLGLPAVVFAGFALQQYGKERRLKEEYAFKSSVSLSLEAYRRLVEEAVTTLTPEDKAKFADFLVTSIGVIFDSPTERVFGSRRQGGPTDTKILAGLLQNLKEVKDIAQGK